MQKNPSVWSLAGKVSGKEPYGRQTGRENGNRSFHQSTF